MKKRFSLYAIGFALLLASGVLLTHPMTTVLATAYCETTCSDGSKVQVSGFSCGCTDKGCSYAETEGAKLKTKLCPVKNSEDFEIVDGPVS